VIEKVELRALKEKKIWRRTLYSIGFIFLFLSDAIGFFLYFTADGFRKYHAQPNFVSHMYLSRDLRFVGRFMDNNNWSWKEIPFQDVKMIGEENLAIFWKEKEKRFDMDILRSENPALPRLFDIHKMNPYIWKDLIENRHKYPYSPKDLLNEFIPQESEMPTALANIPYEADKDEPKKTEEPITIEAPKKIEESNPNQNLELKKEIKTEQQIEETKVGNQTVPISTNNEANKENIATQTVATINPTDSTSEVIPLEVPPELELELKKILQNPEVNLAEWIEIAKKIPFWAEIPDNFLKNFQVPTEKEKWHVRDVEVFIQNFAIQNDLSPTELQKDFREAFIISPKNLHSASIEKLTKIFKGNKKLAKKFFQSLGGFSLRKALRSWPVLILLSFAGLWGTLTLLDIFVTGRMDMLKEPTYFPEEAKDFFAALDKESNDESYMPKPVEDATKNIDDASKHIDDRSKNENEIK